MNRIWISICCVAALAAACGPVGADPFAPSHDAGAGADHDASANAPASTVGASSSAGQGGSSGDGGGASAAGTGGFGGGAQGAAGGSGGAGGAPGGGGVGGVPEPPDECAGAELNAPCSVGWCTSDGACRGMATCRLSPAEAYRCDSDRIDRMTVIIMSGAPFVAITGCWNGERAMISCVPGQQCIVYPSGRYGMCESD